MQLSEAIEQVSKELNLPYEVVNLAYKSYWKFIRETIKKLPLKNKLSKKEFEKLRTNFNIPSIGKLNCTYDRYKALEKQQIYLKKFCRNNENIYKKHKKTA